LTISNIFNQSADYLYYDIGVNPIPADTKNKRINVSWGQHHNTSVSVELHTSRKEKGEYDNGLAVMTGRINKGKNEGKYLIGIDCDNKKAKEEICKSLRFKDINDLAKWTWVEQHKDNLDKAHIYILSTKPFKNKGRNPDKIKLESLNEIPAIEVKCEKQTMFTAPSIHQNGHPYEILGVKEPILCDEFETHLDNIFRKYDSEYLNQDNSNNNHNSKLPEPLKQLVNWLEIPSNFQFRIHEGARHNTMLSFANALLFKYKYDTDINRKDELKKFFNEVNNKICTPSLTEDETKTIWRDALKFSDKKFAEMQIVNDDENDTQNYKSPVVVQLVKGDKLLEKEFVQNLVYDIPANSVDCLLNSKYKPEKRILVPINIKQWPDVRKNFRKLCEEKEIEEEDILLLLECLDSNIDLIKKYYLENHRRNVAALAAAKERKKQRLDLIKEGTDFVMAKYRFLTIEESKDILFYDSSKGVYVYGGDIEIDKSIEKKYGYQLKTNDINEIKNYVIRKTYIKKEEFDSDIEIINVENGLKNWKTGEFFPHTPDFLSLNQKPIKYNPEAKAPKFEKFLSEVLYPEDIRTAKEIIAYTFIRKNIFEYWFVLIGNGANGKNVFVGIVSSLHGSKNISNVPLTHLANPNHRFALSRLENKDINVDTELSAKSYNDLSTLKKLTGTQPITVEKKGKDLYDVELWAKLFFNTNELPLSSDNSDARHRREIILSFPYQFEEEQKDDPNIKVSDPFLLDKIVNDEDEMSGILNIVIDSLKTIYENKKIYVNSTISQRRVRTELIANPVKAFYDEMCEIPSDPVVYEKGEDLYDAFVKFCNTKRLYIPSYKQFINKLKKEHDAKDGRVRISEPDDNGKEHRIRVLFNIHLLTEEEKKKKDEQDDNNDK
jgi:P4 family phage/plasmid primase-like protien